MQTIKTEIGGNPYEVSLNTELADLMPVKGFECYWNIGLQFLELDDNGEPIPEEREAMLALANMMISAMRLSGDILPVGITIYEGVQELVFYSSQDAAKSIGETIDSFKDHFDETFKDRFLGAQAHEDTGWDRVVPHFELWQSAMQNLREE
jgi:hypothetical protein